MVCEKHPLLKRNETKVLTFDCYGTLVDWEQGVCDALRKQLPAHTRQEPDEKIIASFIETERKVLGENLFPYAEVLAKTVIQVCALYGENIDQYGVREFVSSVTDWPVFKETNHVLKRLSTHYRLAIISNIDDELLAKTLTQMTVSFDVVCTSENAQCYKPDKAIFAKALEKLGEPPEAVIHVAEGLCEAVPARELGMGSIWVNRSVFSDDGSGARPHHSVGSLSEVADFLLSEREIRS